jgi:ribosomal protein S18 acetylase RimI-like enzyme
MMRRWLEGWRLCRGLEPVIEYDDAYAAVLRLPGRERELFARTDDPATVDRLARDLTADTWLTVTTQHGAEIARRLADAGAQPFEEQKTLMSIDLREHPTASAEVETAGPLEYVKVVLDGTVAARGMLGVVGSDAVMHDIHTDPAFRRRGLGSVVMGALAGRALARGARTGLLMATTDGFHLYRKLGWSVEATMVTASGAPAARPVSGDLGAVLTRG